MMEDTLSVTVNGQVFLIDGWGSRHDKCPNVKGQIDSFCDGEQFQLLFRGIKELPPYEENLFSLGVKARPLYSAGDPARLLKHARRLASCTNRFQSLVDDFARSSMMQRRRQSNRRDAGSLANSLMEEFEKLNDVGRTRLTQLLLYGLQAQNSRHEVQQWREHLFVLSASTKACVAAKYSLSFHKSKRRNEKPPEDAFVMEYAPPCSKHLFEHMCDVIKEFECLELGEFYPDNDAEVMIPFGMLPHYLLGYSQLRLLEGAPVGERHYSVAYVPNPAIESEGFSLDRPKDLSDEQEHVRKKLNKKVAFAYHGFFGDVGDWYVIDSQERFEDISGTAPTKT